MKRLTYVILFALLSVSMMGLSGCHKKKDVVEPPVVERAEDAQVTTEPDIQGDIGQRPSGKGDRVPESLMKTVYFDFDRFNIRPDQVEYMEANAKYLKENADKKILIEGHCDERGTNEYNMALGQRRATSIKEFLMSRGVSEERLVTMSRGEEVPAVEGTGEAVWSMNRRSEFYYFN